MKNLKEFLRAPNSSGSRELALSKVSKGIANVVLSSGSISTESKAEKFAQKVKELACSDEVISELSDDIGEPLSNESEDEFVARAQHSFKKILMKKLAVK